MAYDGSKPPDDGSLVSADIRENFRALKEDDIVEGVAAGGITESMLSSAVQGLFAQHDGTQIANNNNVGVGGETWDLSSYVGSNRALVVLRVKNETGGDTVFAMWRYGDSDPIPKGGSMSSASLGANDIAHIACVTDASGRIEVASTNEGNFDAWLECFIVLNT